ncbi:MAG: hypothetical protein ACYCUY_01025 [Acidithiobacillus sp.]
MTNTFLNRVSAERRVLSVVNGRLSRAYQLTGLSRAAISRWRASVGLDRTASINPILLSVAEQCQRLSDRSNETFLPLEQLEVDRIERQLIELNKELERFL